MKKQLIKLALGALASVACAGPLAAQKTVDEAALDPQTQQQPASPSPSSVAPVTDGSPVIVQEAAPPQSPSQVVERVTAINQAEASFGEHLKDMSKVSQTYSDNVVGALALTNVTAIDKAVDQARYQWVMAMTRAAGQANARLSGVINAASELATWADSDLRQLKLTLTGRIAAAKRLNKKVELSPEEQLDLDKLGELDLQHVIELKETELSADRLQDVLEKFTDNVAALRAATTELRKTQRYYGQFASGLLTTAKLLDEDRMVQGHAEAVQEAVEKLQAISVEAKSRLMTAMDNWQQMHTSIANR